MLSNAEYLLALPALKLLCAETDRLAAASVLPEASAKNTKQTFEFDNQDYTRQTTDCCE